MPMSEYMRRLRSRVGHQLLEMPAVAIVVRDAQGRVLLVRHQNGGVWVTPGGAVEPTEVPADAAVREMWEETGLEIELTVILGVYGGPEFVVTYRNGDQVSYLMVVFEGRRVGGELRPDGLEVLDARYFTEQETKALRRPEWIDEVLADVFSNRAQAAFRQPRWWPPPDA